MGQLARPTLSRRTYLGYAVGSVGTGVFATVPGLLLLTFLVRQLQVPPALAGLVILLPRLWDVVTDPLVGSLSDRTRSRLGPRRPWLLAGALTLPVAFALLFRVPELAGRPAAVYVLGVYVLGTTAFTIFQVPYVAMPAEMTQDYHERTTILSWRVALLTVGILLAGGLAPEIVAAGGGGRDGYARMGLAIGAVLLTALLACFLGTRAAPVAAPVATTASFRQQLRAAGDNRPFLLLLACFVVQALGIGAMLAGVDFFAAYVLGDPGQTSILFVCLVGPALVTMPLWAWVGHRFGKRAGWVTCSLVFAAGGLSLVTASPQRLWLVYLQVVVMGTAYAGTQLFPFAMLPDAISLDTARSGLRRAGAHTGVWTAGEKGGMAIGPAVYAGILALTGFVETESGAIVDQPSSAVTGVLLGFALVPPLLVVSGLWFLRGYDLDADTVAGLHGSDAPPLAPGAVPYPSPLPVPDAPDAPRAPDADVAPDAGTDAVDRPPESP
ncbi:MFS transporter [Egicoccus halophilus]|uniref:MFS transporter n=1 Tax=Egicoccus halophilus TaxID=1670830 RepID=A0A8J3ESU1_9ACTN|nr:MFS transporter [Egicoccus halophilus]GGI03799.1 MFS transporter [Egicoccus halophilus]